MKERRTERESMEKGETQAENNPLNLVISIRSTKFYNKYQ